MAQNLQDGLVLDLDINNLQDYSGNSNNGSATGTTLIADQLNRFQRARDFNGSTDYILVSDSAELRFDDSFTFSVWLYPKDTNTQYIIMQKRDGSGTNYQYYTHTDGVLRFFDGSTEFSFGYDIDTHVNSWVHLVFVTDTSDNVTLYVNGKSQGSIAASISSYTAPINIGRQYTGSIKFNGRMSEPKIWNRELSADEVQQLFSNVRGNYQSLFEDCIA